MKKIFATIAVVAAALTASAAPVMNFARTVQTADGLPKANLPVKVKVVIRSGAADGPVAFGEEHEVTTSPAGVAYVTIWKPPSIAAAVTSRLSASRFSACPARYTRLPPPP